MILENLKKVEAGIVETCARCKRSSSEIKLIAVSKTHPVEIIKEALKAGLKNFGENKAQELRDKSELIAGDAGSPFVGMIRWHFIGHLQTNKVKYVIKAADCIHAVDSIKLAAEINRKAEQINKTQKILLEVKTSNEATKFGLEKEKEIFEAAEFCNLNSNLKLVGLMTMAPYTDDEKVIRECFIKLREIKEKLNLSGFGLTELSMGMTNDFEIAIEEGATMLRIGTAIFGERN
ncbi:MAG: YggS family pyridoxal phosphate-dependent enzyme [Bacteroidota bacterium]